MRLGLTLLLLCLGSFSALADDTANADAADNQGLTWLQEMSRAMHRLNYSGRFVFHAGGQLEAMDIQHRIDVQGEKEHLRSLTGATREVIRDENQLICLGDDGQQDSVSTILPGYGFPAHWLRVPDSLTQAYRLQLLGEDRIAGRPTRLIAIIPIDELRYGYRVWLDQATSLLLKTDLLTAHGHVLEQLMFTNIEIEPGASPSDAATPPADEATTEDVRAVESAWQANRLPRFFTLREVGQRQNADGAAVEHLLYSDGLATVSVFIEKNSGEGLLMGASSLGAMNAFGVSLEGHHVTVVGEVPVQTVRQIAESISHRGTGHD